MQSDRRFAPRTLVSLLAAVMLLLGSATSVLAQATPDATPASGSGPNLGDTIVLHNSSGDETLKLSASQLVDPDEGVDNADRGFHWVSVELVVNNPTDADIEINPYSVTLVDGEGFSYNPGFASRTNDDMTERPDFSASTVPAGESVSGWMFFQLINDATPAWILFVDSFSSQQFAVLANLTGEAIEEGAETPFYNANADEIGTVSVDQIITDFQKTDSSITPNRGMTAVGVVYTITNTSDADLQANTFNFPVVDDYGFLYYTNYYFRSEESTAQYPDMPTDVIAAGASATGIILYEVPRDAQISYILYQPDYTQYYIVAQPGPGSTVSGDTLTPVAVPTSDSGDETPEATEDTGSTGQETGDCVGVNAWVQASADNINFLNDLFSGVESIGDVSPEQLRDATDQLRDAASTQEDLDIPDVAKETNDSVVNLLNTWADVFDKAADRLEQGDDPADIENDLSNDPDFSGSFQAVFDAETALETTCPDSNVSDLLGG